MNDFHLGIITGALIIGGLFLLIDASQRRATLRARAALARANAELDAAFTAALEKDETAGLRLEAARLILGICDHCNTKLICPRCQESK